MLVRIDGQTEDQKLPASTLVSSLSGTASGLTAGTVTTNANLTGHITSTGNATVLGSFSSANLRTALTDETGTGVAVFGTSPTFTTDITAPEVYGGTGSAENLFLQSTSHATRGRIKCLDGLSVFAEDKTFTAATGSGIVINSTYTLDFTNSTFGSAFNFSPTVVYKQSASGFGGGSLFVNAGSFKNDSTVAANLSSVTCFLANHTMTADSQSITQASQRSFVEQCKFTATGGGALAVTSWQQYVAGNSSSIGSGVTVTTRTGLLIDDIAGSGTLTNNYGIDIEELTKGATLNVGIRNASTLRQIGKAAFGADVTPSFDISLGGNAARTISLERNPTANTAGKLLTVQSGAAASGATNKVGGNLVVQAARGTGNAKPSKVEIQAPAQGTASGTTDQSLVARIAINGTADLTSGVAMTVVTIPLATLQMAGGTLLMSCEVSDGTDVISFSGGCHYSAVNKGGVFSTTTQAILSALAKSDAADTYTMAYTFDTATANTAKLQVTPTLTGMTPTIHRVTATIISNAQQDATII